MAKKTEKKRGVAIGKWAKIDRAQSIMLGAVCGASLVLGITLALSVYLAKTISYNGKVIKYERQAADSYKSVQDNLESVKVAVQDLSTNEALESVARNTTGRQTVCQRFNPKEKVDASTIGLFQTCSALRVIPDVIPVAGENSDVQYASHASLAQLLEWSGLQYESLSSAEATEIFEDKIHTIGFGLTIKEEADKMKKLLTLIESSIRNFDLQSASIRFGEGEDVGQGETLEFSAVYGTYYADKVDVDVHTETICAEPTNKKCPGDTLTNGNVGGGSVVEDESE